jgi:hypothetical protein
MNEPMTIECAFHINRRGKGRQEMQAAESPQMACERGRVPRVTRLLALAHRFDDGDKGSLLLIVGPLKACAFPCDNIFDQEEDRHGGGVEARVMPEQRPGSDLDKCPADP